MLKKVAFPSFSKVLEWVWGIVINRWVRRFIFVIMVVGLIFWIWSRDNSIQTPVPIENITQPVPTADIRTPPAITSEATEEEPVATQVPQDRAVATSVAQTVTAILAESQPTTAVPVQPKATAVPVQPTTAVPAQPKATAVPVQPTATPVQPTAVPLPTAVPVQPTAVPLPTAVPVPPTAVPVPPTAAPVPSTAVPVPTASAPYPYSCVGKFEGSNALEQALAKCPGVTFRIRWTSPRDWDGCMFNSNNIPSDFGSQQVLQGQKLVFWIPRLDEDLSFLPDCHTRINQPSSGGPSLVNSTSECRGMFEGNDALNIARQTCGNKEFRVRWTNPRDPYGCMFTSNRVPKDFNSPEVMQGQKLVFWIPLDSEDMSSIPTCPNLP